MCDAFGMATDSQDTVRIPPARNIFTRILQLYLSTDTFPIAQFLALCSLSERPLGMDEERANRELRVSQELYGLCAIRRESRSSYRGVQ